MSFDQMVSALVTSRPPEKPQGVIAGAVFGRLTITDQSKTGNGTHRFYLCKCSCGGEVWVRKSLLLNGNTKSCGCIRRERAREMQPLAVAALALNPPGRGSDGRYLPK
jgi:hypothetical protein